MLSAGGRVVILDAVVDETTDKAFNEIARLREPAHRRHYRQDELEAIVAARRLHPCASRGSVRRTIDLDYWLQAAAVPPPKADLIRGRFKALPVEVQARMDVAFSDRLVSFSYDVAGLRLERPEPPPALVRALRRRAFRCPVRPGLGDRVPSPSSSRPSQRRTPQLRDGSARRLRPDRGRSAGAATVPSVRRDAALLATGAARRQGKQLVVASRVQSPAPASPA